MKTFRYIILSAVAALLVSVSGMAQTRVITGTVSDSDGNPLIGVSVIATGGKAGTITDVKGNYSIRVDQSAESLEFSYIGYQKATMRIGDRNVINVKMEEATHELETIEVVNIGYGSVAKPDLTGAVSTIHGSKMEGQSMISIDQGLQGRISGVQITQSDASPGGGMNFTIRGSNSLIGGTEPLFVVDGIPIEGGNSEIAAPTGAGNPAQNMLNFLNPSDIESLVILKDASATAIYGARGANGVVLISTKKGRDQSARFTVSTACDWGNVLRRADPGDAYDFAWQNNMRYIVNNVYFGTMSYETALNNLSYKGTWSDNGGYGTPKPEDYRNGTAMWTDWFDVVTRTGFSNKTLASVTGGTKGMTYYVSGGYDHTNGIMIGSDFRRYSLTANMDASLNKKWTLSNSLKASYSYGKIGQSGLLNGDNRGVLQGAYLSNPTTLMAQVLLDEEFGVVSVKDNPYIQATRFKELNSVISVVENVALTYNIRKNLSFRINGGVNYSHNFKDMYYPVNTQRGERLGNGQAFFGMTQKARFLNDYQLNYSTTLCKKHKINLTGVVSYEYMLARGFNSTVYGFMNDLLENYNFSAASKYYKPNSNQYSRQSLSYVARAMYSYDNRYLLTASVRTDGFSAFGANRKWGVFPSAAIAWRVINEKFFNVRSISDLKLRVSYGVTGNSSVSPYQSIELVGLNEYAFGGEMMSGYYSANIANPDLKWEKTYQYNAGIDYGMFRNRLTLTADVYRKDTKDLLQNERFAPSAGYDYWTVNRGWLRNEGVEIALQGVIINRKGFYWDISANWYKNQTTVMDLGGLDEYRVGTLNSWAPFIIKPGSKLGTIYGYKVSNIIKTEEQKANAAIDNPNKNIGNYDYEKDENGYMLEQPIGNTNPDFCYGFSTTISVKGFTVSANFSGSVGNDILNAQKQVHQLRTQSHKSTIYNYWIPEIRDSQGNVVIPDNGKNGLCIGNTTNSAHDISKLVDHYIEDGSFFKMNNLSIAYLWRPRKISWIESLQPSVAVNNLFCITNYSGVNPEASAHGQNPITKGVAYYEYPVMRTWSFGLKLTFK